MDESTCEWPVFRYNGRNYPARFDFWTYQQKIHFENLYDELERQKDERRRIRTDLRRAKRIDAALEGKWDRCCIPGCGQESSLLPDFKPNSAQDVPVCWDHAVMITRRIEPEWHSDDVMVVRVMRAVKREQLEAQVAVEEEADYQRGYLDGGHLYFVRVGDMIKLGWSSKLRARLKQYGASAEVLCHWLGTRADETSLHRQLRPQLAAGREWYHDNDVLAGVVSDYIKRHGAPTVLPTWTAPKPDVVAKKRRAA